MCAKCWAFCHWSSLLGTPRERVTPDAPISCSGRRGWMGVGAVNTSHTLCSTRYKPASGKQPGGRKPAVAGSCLDECRERGALTPALPPPRPGGRMTTRRTSWKSLQFDHGCQFVRAVSAEFRAVVDSWVDAGAGARHRCSHPHVLGLRRLCERAADEAGSVRRPAGPRVRGRGSGECGWKRRSRLGVVRAGSNAGQWSQPAAAHTQTPRRQGGRGSARRCEFCKARRPPPQNIYFVSVACGRSRRGDALGRQGGGAVRDDREVHAPGGAGGQRRGRQRRRRPAASGVSAGPSGWVAAARARITTSPGGRGRREKQARAGASQSNCCSGRPASRARVANGGCR
jgi:hypothetical protein